MSRTLCLLLLVMTMSAAELPSRKTLNAAALRTMAAVVDTELARRNVQASVAIVDDGGNLLYFLRGDGARLGTVALAQKKAKQAAIYGRPSKVYADRLKGGELEILMFPDAFPNQGGLPIVVDGQIIGGIGVSGAPSEIDEAIAQAAIDALLKK